MWLVCLAAVMLGQAAPVQTPVCLLPVPQRVEVAEQAYMLGEGGAIWISSEAGESIVYAAEDCAGRLSAGTGVPWCVSRSEGLPAPAAVVQPVDVTLPTDPEAKPPALAEGYVISVLPDRVEICGHDEAGLFYGLQTLAQLVERDEGEWRFPAVRISDWPDYQIRGVQVSWENSDPLGCPDPEFTDYKTRDQTYTDKAFIEQIRMLARFKVNTVFWEPGRNFEFKLHPDLNTSPRLSQEDIRRIVDEAAKVHVTIIPMVNSFAHVQRIVDNPSYARLQEETEPGQLCPSEPDALELLDDIYGEICSIVPGEYIHIGCGEIGEFGDERCLARAREKGWVGEDGKITPQGRNAICAEYITECADLLRKRGRRAIIWADMMTPDIAKAIPKDVVLSHRYDAQDPQRGINLFPEHDSLVAPSAMGSGSAYLIPMTRSERGDIKLMCANGKGKSMGVCAATSTTFPGPPQNALWNAYLYAAERMWTTDFPRDDAEWPLSFARNFYGFESAEIGKAWDILGKAPRGDASRWRKILILSADPEWFVTGEGKDLLSEERARELLNEAETALAAIDSYVAAAKEAGINLDDDRTIALLRHSAKAYRHIAHTRLWWPHLADMAENDRNERLATMASEAEELLVETIDVWSQVRRIGEDYVVQCWRKVYRKSLDVIEGATETEDQNAFDGDD